jgi:putative oxidoreductase
MSNLFHEGDIPMNSRPVRYLPAVGRLLIAAIFLISGLGKVAAPTTTQGYIASVGLPLPVVVYLIAVVVEVCGGVLLIVGYQTRVVAAILAVFAVATALSFHTAFGDQNQMVHFFKNICMAGGLLQVVAFGAGALSIDNRRSPISGPYLATR